MALSLTVDINADMVKFAGQVDKAMEKLGSFQAKTESISSKINGTLAGLGAGLSVAGISAFVKSGIDAADALNDLSDRSGIAIESLAGLQYAVKLGDTNIESFVAASNKLSINVAKNSELFKQLGVDAKDPVKQFEQFADVFASIEDPQTRAAVGAAALGKSYAELAPLLVRGAAGIEQLITRGQELNPITAQQAALAGAFNDKLDEMSSRSLGLRASIGVGVLEPLSFLADALDKNIAKFGLLKGVMTGFADGYQNFALSGTGGGISAELDNINKQIGLKKDLLARANSGEEFIGEGRKAGLTREIKNLQSQRDKVLQDLSNQASQASEAKVKASEEQIKKWQEVFKSLLKIGDDGANTSESSAKAAAKAEENRLKSINDVIAGLQQDISIGKLSEDQQRRAIELSSALKNAKGGEIEAITALVNAKHDDIEASKRQQAQWQQLVADANSRVDLEKEVDQFSRLNSVTVDSFGLLIGKIQDTGKEIGMTDQQINDLLTKAGKGFNENFTGPAMDGVDQLSVYAEQAAKNMETAFADFLFDPFAKGTQSMAEGFLNVVKRMAADAASAQLMESLFGKAQSGGGRDFSSGLLGIAVSGLTSYFGVGSTFAGDGPLLSYMNHAGGMAGSMTYNSPLPASLFTGAARYHSGGVAGLKPNEIPTVLTRGEEVLTLNDPRHRNNLSVGSSGGDIQITTNVNVSGNADQKNAGELGRMINSKVREVIMTEKRPGGILA